MTSSEKLDGVTTFIAFIVGMNYLTEAYYDGPVLVGDSSFIRVNYTLKQDTQGHELSLPSFVGSDEVGVALDYTLEGGLITTKAFGE